MNMNEYPGTKTVAEDVRVWVRYARALASNELEGDRRQALYLAPQVEEECEIFWVEGNADPIYIGLCDRGTGRNSPGRFVPVEDQDIIDWMREEYWLLAGINDECDLPADLDIEEEIS